MSGVRNSDVYPPVTEVHSAGDLAAAERAELLRTRSTRSSVAAALAAELAIAVARRHTITAPPGYAMLSSD